MPHACIRFRLNAFQTQRHCLDQKRNIAAKWKYLYLYLFVVSGNIDVESFNLDVFRSLHSNKNLTGLRHIKCRL